MVADALMGSSMIMEIAINGDGMPQSACADEPEAVRVFGFEREENR